MILAGLLFIAYGAFAIIFVNKIAMQAIIMAVKALEIKSQLDEMDLTIEDIYERQKVKSAEIANREY